MEPPQLSVKREFNLNKPGLPGLLTPAKDRNSSVCKYFLAEIDKLPTLVYRVTH